MKSFDLVKREWSRVTREYTLEVNENLAEHYTRYIREMLSRIPSNPTDIVITVKDLYEILKYNVENIRPELTCEYDFPWWDYEQSGKTYKDTLASLLEDYLNESAWNGYCEEIDWETDDTETHVTNVVKQYTRASIIKNNNTCFFLKFLL